MSFLVLPQNEQFYPEGLSVFAPCRHLRIQVGQSKHRNSRTFQQRLQFSRIFKASIFFGKFKDFQGACKPWSPRPFLKKKKRSIYKAQKTGHMQLHKVLTMHLSRVLKVATPRKLQCIKMIFQIAYSCMSLFKFNVQVQCVCCGSLLSLV